MSFYDDITGIYKIQSGKKHKRFYIGASANIFRRWKEHLYKLRRQKHYNPKLQEHFNKYGESDLHFSIIVCCDKKALKGFEQFYIDAYEPYFNQCLTNGAGFHKRHLKNYYSSK